MKVAGQIEIDGPFLSWRVPKHPPNPPYKGVRMYTDPTMGLW